MVEQKRIRAVCTWGDGPDVSVTLNLGDKTNIWTTIYLSMSVEDALEFAEQLITAGEDASYLQASYELMMLRSKVEQQVEHTEEENSKQNV